MTTASVSETQRQVLQYVSAHISERGYSPTYRDVQKHFGWSSTNAVRGHVKALVSAGMMEIRKGQRGVLYPLDAQR